MTLPRWVVRRLPVTVPNVEQERRVQRYLYGTRTQVSLVGGERGRTGDSGSFGVPQPKEQGWTQEATDVL